jgi:hypothetical protein
MMGSSGRGMSSGGMMGGGMMPGMGSGGTITGGPGGSTSDADKRLAELEAKMDRILKELDALRGESRKGGGLNSAPRN